jgi:hypothetical protein
MTRGYKGTCPDWYALRQAAKDLNCSPWDLEERPDGQWWAARAQVALAAEAKVREHNEGNRR